LKESAEKEKEKKAEEANKEVMEEVEEDPIFEQPARNTIALFSQIEKKILQKSLKFDMDTSKTNRPEWMVNITLLNTMI
jgi:hypothetical protein